MKKITDTLFKFRFIVLLGMFVFSLVNSVRFWGEWNNFYSVIAAQVYSVKVYTFLCLVGVFLFRPEAG